MPSSLLSFKFTKTRTKLNHSQPIFGMHLFDTTDSGSVAAQPKFIITLVVLSVSTYIAAVLGFWLVRNHEKHVTEEGAAAGKKKYRKKDVKKDVKTDDESKRKGKSGVFASIRKRKGKGKGIGKAASATGENVELAMEDLGGHQAQVQR